jgi:hypothetical protein
VNAYSEIRAVRTRVAKRLDERAGGNAQVRLTRRGTVEGNLGENIR